MKSADIMRKRAKEAAMLDFRSLHRREFYRINID